MLRYFKIGLFHHVLCVIGTIILLFEIVYYIQLFKRRLWENQEFAEVMASTGVSSADFWVAQHAYLTRDSIIKLRDNTCKIPIINPFASSMVEYYRPWDNLTCDGKKKFYYFQSHVDNSEGEDHQQSKIIIYRDVPTEYKCCYEHLRFSNTTDYKPIKSPPENCTFFSGNNTVVPCDSEYLIVKCWNTTAKKNVSSSKLSLSADHHELLFYVPKPSMELLETKNELLERRENRGKEDLLNIIILGFHQISRANFIRLFRNSFKYLRKELDVIDLQGFNKAGDATLNNTLALFAGHTFDDISRNPNWWDQNNTVFDKCPWIWKNFSQMGYITGYADDHIEAFRDTFKGFQSAPTDYYNDPFLKWYRDSQASRWKKFGKHNCIGDKPALDFFQDRAIKFSSAMKNHPYFNLIWISPTDESPGGYRTVADMGTLRTLQYFKDSDVLNRSLVILTSDHGCRADPIMLHHQIRLESRLPFAFLILPQWFRQKFSVAYANMKDNQYRLTTPYDIHSTLEDMLNPSGILSDEVIKKRVVPSSSGISLFLPVPQERTCADAGIDEEWCACTAYKSFAVDSPMAVQLGNYAVHVLNTWLRPFPACRQFIFNQVISAEVKVSSDHTQSTIRIHEKQQYRLVLSTKPRNKGASFEVTIFTEKDYWQNGGSKAISMSTEVSRLDRFDKADCIKDSVLRSICVCKGSQKKKQGQVNKSSKAQTT